MFFKPIFKEAILNGTMTAFVSKNIEVKVGDKWNFTISDVGISINNNHEEPNLIYLTEAECVCVLKFNTIKDWFNDENFYFNNHKLKISSLDLGFKFRKDFHFYLEEIFNISIQSYDTSHNITGFLHIFEVIKDKTNLNQNN